MYLAGLFMQKLEPILVQMLENSKREKWNTTKNCWNILKNTEFFAKMMVLLADQQPVAKEAKAVEALAVPGQTATKLAVWTPSIFPMRRSWV